MITTESILLLSIMGSSVVIVLGYFNQVLLVQFFIGTYLKKKRKKILDKINGSKPDETLSNFSNLIELQLTRAIGLCSPGHSGLVQMKLLSNPRA